MLARGDFWRGVVETWLGTYNAGYRVILGGRTVGLKPRLSRL